MTTALHLNQYIDHTILLPGLTQEKIKSLCLEARENQFAAVCVNPIHVKTAAKELQGSTVKVATVVGFPLGENTTTIKVAETKECIANGASEIDMVINNSALKSEDYETVKHDISEVVKASQGKAEVKVILETGILTEEEIKKACMICVEAGADFVKTSTGMLKNCEGATIETVTIMSETVKPFGLKVKASGGIRTREDAIKMIEAGADRIGTSSGVEIVR